MINKRDSSSGERIALTGSVFRLEHEDGTPVVQHLYYPYEQDISEFEVAGDGTLTLPQPLAAGKYRLYEVSAPYGWLLNTEYVEFVVTSSTGTVKLEVDFYDDAVKGEIQVTKYGEQFATVEKEDSDYGKKHTLKYNTLLLSGLEFMLIADEDIVTADGTVWYTADEEIGLLADDNGIYTYGNLPLGRYRVEERSTADELLLDTEPRYFELTYEDQHTAIVYDAFDWMNTHKPVSIKLQKNMELGIGKEDKPFAGVVFGLFNKSELTAADGSVVVENSLLELVTPDTNGKAALTSPLPVGEYYIKELKTSDGYRLNTAEYPFEITYEADIDAIEIVLNDGNPVVNEINRGSGKLIKTDVSGHKLSGAVFRLYADNNTLIGEYTTQKSGEIIVGNLSYGGYYWQEVSAPDGFIKDTTKHYFFIINDGEIVEVKAVNKTPDIPQTGDDTIVVLWIILVCCITLAAIIAVSYMASTSKIPSHRIRKRKGL